MKLTKEDSRYWEARIHTSNGGQNWNCFFQHQGERKHLSIPPSVQAFSAKTKKQLAAEKAKEIYQSLKANGWPVTLAKYWSKTATEKKTDVTVGEFLDAVKGHCQIKAGTLTGYTTCFRRIVGDVFNFGESPNYQTVEHEEWMAKVRSVKLAKLTPEKVQQWQVAYMARAKRDLLSQRRAKTSCNTTLRQARSLFSRDVVAIVQSIVELPDPLPFSKVKFSDRQSMKYQGGVSVEKLIAEAQRELAEAQPEQFKIILLGAMVGLRRREIDLLEWDSFLWDRSAIEIKPTKFFEAKSEDSYGKIEVDPELMEAFRGYRARASGEFVIESEQAPKLVGWNRYRCGLHFEKLALWLRAHEVTGDKPLHTLRKEFGSRINAIGGIHAASRALRHADLSVTSGFYTDNRSRVVTGLGHLLEPSNIVPMREAV